MEYRLWVRTIVLVLVLNAGFLALSFSTTLVPQETIAERIRHAFATGDLGERSRIPYDTHLGWHQYNDCIILQMISNRDTSTAGRALGPWILFDSLAPGKVCHTLRELVIIGRDPATLISSRYTRYWHG